MNNIKKILGIAWMALSIFIIAALVYRAIVEFQRARPEQLAELKVFWPVVIIIFIPIAIGLFIFGNYSYKEEYKRSGTHLSDP